MLERVPFFVLPLSSRKTSFAMFHSFVQRTHLVLVPSST